tara:strand:- start:3931 stop:4818 length:888 start_codon:yes stop_codon:yes gene_type:complete
MFETLVTKITQNYKQENIDFLNKLCIGKTRNKNACQNIPVCDELGDGLEDYKMYIPNYHDFYILKTISKDCFIEAILIHLYKNFYNFDSNEKKRLIIEFRKYLSYNITTFLKSNKKISRKFGKKGYLQEKLLSFSKILVNEPYINKYIVNLMNINIYVFNGKTVDAYYSEKDFVSKYKPTLFLEYKDDRFNALSHQSFQLLKFSNKFGEILDKLFIKYGAKYIHVDPVIDKTIPDEITLDESFDLDKMKVKDLREYVKILGISIQKKSVKTKKMIFKLKNELLDDIKNINSVKTI